MADPDKNGEQRSHVRYYILFANYEQGLSLHLLLDEAAIPNRIAPAPRAIQGELTCGVSLLLEPEWVDAAKKLIEEVHAPYHAIVPLENQLLSRRDTYC